MDTEAQGYNLISCLLINLAKFFNFSNLYLYPGNMAHYMKPMSDREFEKSS